MPKKVKNTKKSFLKTFLICAVGCLIFFGPMFLSDEIKKTFGQIEAKLEAKTAKVDSVTYSNRTKLLQTADSLKNLDPGFSDELKLLVGSIDETYQDLQQELDRQIGLISKIEILMKKNADGTANSLGYWMGNEPESNGGRGNGQARLLREKINEFRHQIIQCNEEFARSRNLDEYYQPEILDLMILNNKAIPWEKWYFQGQVFIDLVYLAELKLEQAEIYKNEIDFLSRALVPATNRD